MQIAFLFFNFKLPNRLRLYDTPTVHLQKGKTSNEVPGYDSKQSDDEVLLMLDLWGMQSTPSLPSLPGPLWPRVVAIDSVQSMGQIELNRDFEILLFFFFAFKLRTYDKLN